MNRCYWCGKDFQGRDAVLVVGMMDDPNDPPSLPLGIHFRCQAPFWNFWGNAQPA